MSKAIAVTSKLLNGKKFASKSAMIKNLYFEQKKGISEIATGEGILYQMVRNIVKIEENNRFVFEHKKVEEKEEVKDDKKK